MPIDFKLPRRVMLESPYAGDVDFNEAFARACLRDSLLRGEAPFASHLLYTQPGVLDDRQAGQRELGMLAGLAYLPVVESTVVYTDNGISPGMLRGITGAKAASLRIEYRVLRK